uniref:Si:ch211-214j8.12 n=1 Tax=Sinocyclocheilus anshuiensis TaxID=1608454 RepID=A0A671PB20_9TELE
MPLFRQLEPTPERERQRKNKRKNEWTEDDDEPSTLIGLCLQSLAENMKEMWAKDYTQKYMDQYFFRYIMGPFSSLRDECYLCLLCILSSRNLLTRAALHLLLLPQLSCLSLTSACSLVNANLYSLIEIRCQVKHTHTPLSKYISYLPTVCVNVLVRLHLLCSHAVAAVAFLLLSLPGLQRLAMEGLGQACALIQNKQFEVTEEFSSQEGVPLLKDMWAKRTHEDHLKDSSLLSTDREESFTLEGKIDEFLSLEESQTDASDSTDINEWTRTSGDGCEKDGCRSRACNGRDSVTTSLRDVQGLSLDTLEAVGKVCPELRVLSLDCLQNNVDDNVDSFEQAAVLARGLGTFSGQLSCLSLQFAGLLSELVPALKAAGSHLLSLTLEGIKADGHIPLLELIHACPRLTSLTVHLDPPRNNLNGEEEEEEEEGEDEGLLSNLPCIPHLRSLTLNFSLDERHLKPALCWRSLKGVLWALLRGASLLQKLSLIAVPCRLDPVFKLVLNHWAKPLGALDSPPLHCLRSASLNRSDISMETVIHIVNTCRRLSHLDLSGCWALTLSNITKLQCKAKRRRHTLQITWT